MTNQPDPPRPDDADDGDPSPKRTPPVSLRLGELENDVLKRRNNESIATVLRRDLGRYYAASRQTVRGLGFTSWEAGVLAQALDRSPLEGPTLKYLWAEVDEWLRRHDVAVQSRVAAQGDGTVSRDEASKLLVEKLRQLSPIECAAVLDSVEIWNSHEEHNDPFDTAEISGLTADIDHPDEEYFKYLEGQKNAAAQSPGAKAKG